MRLVQHTALGILHNTTGPSPHQHHDISNLDTHQTRRIHTTHTHTTTKRTGRIPAMGGQCHFVRRAHQHWFLGRTAYKRGAGAHNNNNNNNKVGVPGTKRQSVGRVWGLDLAAFTWASWGAGGCYFGPWLGHTKRVCRSREEERTGIMYIECGMGIPPLAPCRALYRILSGGWLYAITAEAESGLAE